MTDSDLAVQARSWQRALRARNLAPKTLHTYSDSLDLLVEHANARRLADLDRDAIRRFLADQAERHSPATVSVRFRALQQVLQVPGGRRRTAPLTDGGDAGSRGA